MALKLLIVDDHEIVRQGLISLFGDSDIRVCGEAASAEEAVRQARKHKPDVVLLDVRLKDDDGLDVIKRLRAACPAVRVVILSAFDNPTYVARAVSAGAHDYLLKTATRQELIASVTGAATGASPTRSGQLKRMVNSMAKREPATSGGVQLTPREAQVLRTRSLGPVGMATAG